jgi:hypothetical protein
VDTFLWAATAVTKNSLHLAASSLLK